MTTPFEEIKLDLPTNIAFNALNELRAKNLFCDVTLDISGTLFPCHRFVLTDSSTYFQIMFNGNFKESSLKTIPIQDIDAKVMEILLSAIYTARIRLLPKNAYFVLKASHVLQCDRIFNACVDCIIKNVDRMLYLPETCAFAKTIGAEKLYDVCIERLAETLIYWGKTDAIIKWSKDYNISAKDIRMLLQLPTFSQKYAWTSAVAGLMVAARSEDSSRSVGYGIQFNDGDLSLNLYLNSIDVKSGARGWGRLKLNESFDYFTLSNFQAADLPVCYHKCCTIGSKIYCFESNYSSRKNENVFSYFEDNSRIDLQLPNDLKGLCYTVEMIAAKKTIYLFDGHFPTNIWVYHCELDTWDNNVFQIPQSSSMSSKSVLYDYSLWSGITYLDHVLYVVGCENHFSKSDNRYIVAIDSRAPQISNCIAFPNPFQHENAAVCAFDGKIAISGSNHDGALHNTFSIFDVTANKWRTDLEPMNEGRARHKLIYRNGFIYAVERRPFIENEKYDVKLNTWIEIPKLPERAQFVNADGVNMTIGFCDVICAE
ncbi:kelch-like ECH-associated protein 1 isoform X2 [Planococcus citri]|uniref:kelch-like ECH-associated protein 1 isoform X2 n=1 Tax=Planococcus citri TaxID=170843 RepID=UPI0031F72FE4